MKKLGQVFKEESESLIINCLKEVQSFILMNYSKISSPDITSLRKALKTANSRIFMVKNSVAHRALKGSGWESLTGLIQGPCGFVFIKDDPVRISKVLCDFVKERDAVKLQGGFLKDRVLTQDDIKRLASLPSREILLTKLAVVLNSPITGLVIVLNQTLRKFISCLEQIKNKKQTSYQEKQRDV